MSSIKRVHLKDDLYVTSCLGVIPGGSIKIDGYLEFISESESNWYVMSQDKGKHKNYARPELKLFNKETAKASLISAVAKLFPEEKGDRALMKKRIRIYESVS